MSASPPTSAVTTAAPGAAPSVPDASADLERIFGDDVSDVSDLPSDFFEESSDDDATKTAAPTKKKPLQPKKPKAKSKQTPVPGPGQPDGLADRDDDDEDDGGKDDSDSDGNSRAHAKKQKKTDKALPSFRKRGASGDGTARAKAAKKSAPRKRKDDTSVPLTASEARLKATMAQFDEVVESLKPRNRKEVINEEELEAIARKLKGAMISAWETDIQDTADRRPAVSKLRLLPVLKDHMSKPLYHEIYMDCGVLDAMKLWLEPSADAVLATKSIRQELFDILSSMAVTTDHLRESKIGVVVNFLSKTELEAPEMRAKWADLMYKWIRPITNSSADYRDLDVRMSDSRKQRRREETSGPLTSTGPGRVPEHRTHNPEGVKGTRIPQQFNSTLVYAPAMSARGSSGAEIRENARDRGDGSYARLSQKMKQK